MKKLVKILDNILLVIILLSIVQIIMDDVSVLKGWGDNFGFVMIIIGVAFDLIFSIEFIVRAIVAIKNKDFKNYFFYRKGWIDFVASIPLLATSSGPMFYLAITGKAAKGGRSMINVLKVIKAIRVTRILRLLRTLKIFGKIENVYSKMSQHHISTVASIVISTSVAVFMAATGFGLLNLTDAVVEARVSITFTIVMIANVLMIAFLYAKHFAQNISDPIYVIKRGMLEDEYNFTAKIKEPYKDEEVFELAEVYNTVWMPMKVRIQTIRSKKEASVDEIVGDDDYSDLL